MRKRQLYRLIQERNTVVFIILFLLVPFFFIIDIFSGSYHITFSEIIKALIDPINTDPRIATIVKDYRIPKAVTAILAGSALSVAGLQMQTVFRNPLAGPDILGVSSGASLGVALLVLSAGGIFASGISSLSGSWGIAGAAWIGSGSILVLMILISARIRDIMTILILGILISSGIISVVNILQYFSNESMLKSFVIWTMGSLGSVTNLQLSVLMISVIAGLAIALLVSKFLDAFLLGENYARSMGMNVPAARMTIFISASILAGSVTAFCGPIGFIGIAVPHLARIILRTAMHHLLVPGTILLGSVVMLLSDIISQLPGSEKVLPINSITSLLGIPVVIWIIVRNKNVGYL